MLNFIFIFIVKHTTLPAHSQLFSIAHEYNKILTRGENKKKIDQADVQKIMNMTLMIKYKKKIDWSLNSNNE